jgi:hypothetical protein
MSAQLGCCMLRDIRNRISSFMHGDTALLESLPQQCELM